ncbi:MAG: DUF4249 domain-containing protein [Pedobacter sp.]|jgi:hypothetical protein
MKDFWFKFKYEIRKTGMEYKSILMLFTGFLILTSCEDVIDLDLQKTEPRIVIDGSISNQNENHFVRISKTIPFDASNTFNGLKGAKVSLTTSGGLSVSLKEISDGVYRSPMFRGTPGVTYKLEVIAEGKVYTASSTMPNPVLPDSISFKQLSFFGNTRVYPNVYYKDPANVQNQYRYILKVNNKQQADIVFEDRFNDGNNVSDLIIYDSGDDLKRGDVIDIEMQTIDRNVFKYYYAIGQIRGENGPPVAPANPDSNFSNGALGVFNACTRSSFTITLK